MFGWALTFTSACGNATIDIFKKNLLQKGLSSWEIMALMNAFGGFLTLGYCLYCNLLPPKMDEFILWSGLLTTLGKLLAQWCYYQALSRAPLSHVIPYLAWNPLFLLLVGFLFLGEQPRPLGILGCVIVLAGAYLISLDAKAKQERQNSSRIEYSAVGDETRTRKSCFLIEFIKALISFKAGLFMMSTALCWTYTSALEKYTLYGSDIPAPYFVGVQRVMMAVPCMLYCIYTKPKYINHTITSFVPILAGAFFESLTVITYFMAIQYVYVSYVIAIKRGGNIFISVIVGRFYYGEQLTPMTIGSACCMIAGVLCIVLS